ncbi:hypothetical protein [Geomonas subterranea]|uniref:hypothetical protein n=1 Tax=Geomonas subterranea TaxID=2847989 RepID=UPI001CD42A68|nr:hypothetical protein [Geomonas fuzhouensis]
MKEQIVEELIKQGWRVDPRDNPKAVIARLPVRTFRGMDSAKALPIVVFEDGGVAVKAEFISRGENTLASCCAYIKTEDEIKSKIAVFNAEVLEHLSQSFSVRLAAFAPEET